MYITICRKQFRSVIMNKRLIIIFTTAILFATNLTAQVALSSFEGTWRYTNASTNEEFTIKLRKTIGQFPWGGEECLVGSYIYKKNGVVIHDNMNMFNNNGYPTKMPILVKQRLTLFVNDYGMITCGKPKFVGGSLILVRENDGTAKLIWKLKEREGVKIVGITDEPEGFTIPSDVTLLKVVE